jgi:hypothetical protein
MFSAFSAAEANRFGKELAGFLLSEMAAAPSQSDAKFAAKVEKLLLRADQRVAEFKKAQSLNFYQRARLANTFLWTLKEGGCSDEYADKLTSWLSMRL